MLKFFQRTYEDEIAYSIFARYGVLNGNTGFRQTSNELFGAEISSHSVYYSMYLDHLINQLPDEMGITSDSFIKENTIFPFFKPFMSELRAELVNKNMCSGSTKSLRERMGINSGDIFNKNGHTIKICPLCFKEENDKNGEAYAHRLHQIPGNFICEKHEIYLNEYEIPTNKNIFFDINDINSESFSVDGINDILKNYYLNLSHDIKYVLNGGYAIYNKDNVQAMYRNKLCEKGYLKNNRIDQRKLMDDFSNFYPIDFLMKLESDIDINNSDCWLTNLSTSKAEYVHPIRHLLFIRFLFGSAESLIVNEDIEYKPFGEGPWPCLNPAAEHFGELVIDNCLVKSCGERKGVIGYLKCACGFEYTRKGPDESENDKYRYTSVSQRGEVWENRLRDLILNTNLSVTKLGIEMKCSTDIILKYAIDMGIYDKLNTKMKIKYKPRLRNNIDIELYKSELVEFISSNPAANRTEIKAKLTKEYMMLYKNERDWLDSVLPKPFKDGKSFNRGYTEEDWIELDKKLCIYINAAIMEILNNENSQRVTIKQIAKKINYYGIQNPKILLKLQNTKKLLTLKCETLEQYHKRIQIQVS